MKYLFLCAICLALFSCASKKTKSLLPPAVNEEAQKEPEAIYRLEFDQVPEVGKSTTRQKIFLGGFSGLRYLGRSKEGKLQFLTHTNQGPVMQKSVKEEITQQTLVLPEFQPRLVFFEVDLEMKSVKITRQIPLKQPNGKPLSGRLPQMSQYRSVDLFGKPLAYDVYGMDLEGIDQAEDGSYWLAEQYGPSIAHFSKQGSLVNLLKPGKGLPKILEMRKGKNGFEGIAVTGKKLYATMQPLVNKDTSRVLRMVEVDLLGSRTLGQYVYLLEADGGQKIEDMALLGPRHLLFLEKGHSIDGEKTKKVFLANMEEATNLQLLPEKIAGVGGSLEEMSERDLANENIRPIKKKILMDLSEAGIKEKKVEGMDLVEGSYLAFISNNNYMLSGKWNKEHNQLELSQEKSVLYLIKVDEEKLEF